MCVCFHFRFRYACLSGATSGGDGCERGKETARVVGGMRGQERRRRREEKETLGKRGTSRRHQSHQRDSHGSRSGDRRVQQEDGRRSGAGLLWSRTDGMLVRTDCTRSAAAGVLVRGPSQAVTERRMGERVLSNI